MLPFSLETIQFWHWWALGGVLGVLEIIAPGFALIWLGLAGMLVGLMLLVWPGIRLADPFLATLPFPCSAFWSGIAG